MRDRANDTKFYTLKTTQSTEPSSVETEEYDETTETTTETVDSNVTIAPDDNAKYIKVELPIMNVSGKFIPGEVSRKNVYDIDDSFDSLYDVTPRRGMSYDTSIIPLVQFSLKNTDVQQKGGEDDYKYKMNYNWKPVTPDDRLLLSSRFVKKNSYKQKYNANNRLNFKTKKPPLAITQHVLANFTKGFTIGNSSLVHKEIPGNISWDFIDDLMRSFRKTAPTKRVTTTTLQIFSNTSNLLQNILDTKHISSVYLSPNLSIYYKDVPLHASVTRKPTITTENSFQVIKATENDLLSTKSTVPIRRHTNVANAAHADYNNSAIKTTSSWHNISFDVDGDSIIVKTSATTTYENSTSSIFITKRDENLTGSLVDRESWDNVVQVAPVMAGILYLKANQTQIQDFNVTSGTKRKKRYIESVPVENARPHNITTKGDVITTAAAKYDIADMQDFAQLVEIQDDELHGRVALRYLRRYVGPALFNICDTDTATRHVYLFNSSRIVLAISNFTMDSMTVIITPARTVMTGDGQCPADHLECQVSGARVCIDSLTACDGIPNCGSYEIYDEDRLMCGAAIGLQHNVYLAAFAFLAVLLTTLYGVHYWLKRWVPKVSEAFFLYTNGSENMLYLDTIMRSPTDEDDVSKMAYQGNILDDDLLMFSEVSGGKKSKRFKRFFKSFFTCSLFRKKRKKQDAYDSMAQEGLYASLEENKKRYSYAELELRKMLDAERLKRDIAVQTSDSLEMRQSTRLGTSPNSTKRQFQVPQEKNITESLLVLNENVSLQDIDKLRSLDELNILNFFNSKESTKSMSSDTVKTNSPDRSSITFEEKEINIHTYDQKTKTDIPKTSTLAKAYAHGKGLPDRGKKHLRFEEETTTIPPKDQEDESDEEVSENLNRRRSVVFGCW
ncbi:uncharacterized protein LOC119191814 [Manduca sexta]|uniref:uncharacterized protein LOC119191814 n=1 Tax=Manduca sexta TaxID=7130 RepID=UPI00188E8051|nr:uncharacterized protein LOC119191814 [Manduca sexta]